MRGEVRLAVMVGAVLLLPAWQSPPPDPGPTTASATARAGAVSRSSAQQSVTVNGAGGAAAGGGGGGGTTRAPDVFVPSVGSGGQCGVVGFGVGGSGLGGGGGFGPSWESTNCRNYYIARLLYQQGHPVAATILLGKITPEAREALAAERQQQATVVAPVVATAPALPHPDWCYTASAAERARFAACR